MKSRKQKEKMRHILSGNKEIIQHPEWWGNSVDPCYSPFVNTMVECNLYPWTWGMSKEQVTFTSAYCSFIYTYMTKGSKLKNGIANIYISGNKKEYLNKQIHEDFEIVVDHDDIQICLKKSPLDGELCFEIYDEVRDSSSIQNIMPLLAEFMQKHYDAELMIVGSTSLNREDVISNFNVLVSILESYWSYAENGCTYMYRFAKRNKNEEIDFDSMFEKFEISDEDLKHQKDGYQEVYNLVLKKCGQSTLNLILLNFKHEDNKREIQA